MTPKKLTLDRETLASLAPSDQLISCAGPMPAK